MLYLLYIFTYIYIFVVFRKLVVVPMIHNKCIPRESSLFIRIGFLCTSSDNIWCLHWNGKNRESLDFIISSLFYLQTEYSCLSSLSLPISFPTLLKEIWFQPSLWKALARSLQEYWVDIFSLITRKVTQVTSRCFSTYMLGNSKAKDINYIFSCICFLQMT